MNRITLKKAAAIGLCCSILISGTVFAGTLKFDSDLAASRAIDIKLNGQRLETDVNPIIYGGRTLMPIEEITEKLGAKMIYDLQTGGVEIFTKDITIEFAAGKDTAEITENSGGILSEKSVKLDVTAKIIDKQIFSPVRFVAETLGAKVEWDDSSKSVIIEFKTDNAEAVKPLDFEIIEPSAIKENKLLFDWYESSFKTKGIHSMIDDRWMYVLISAGEKTTGGYSLQINNITGVPPQTAYVDASLISPDKDSDVTQVLTYPNILIRFAEENIKTVKWTFTDEQKAAEEANKREKISVKNLVEDFGKFLQKVALLAPEDILKDSIKENYGEFISLELLEKWQKDPENIPGRIVSSPWPDRIEVLSINKISETEYEVKGDIVEITSVGTSIWGIAGKRPIDLSVKKTDAGWLIDDAVLGDYKSYEDTGSIIYENEEYGFDFSLPETWKGYSIVTDKWEEVSMSADTADTVETGPVIYIMHPLYTAENPRQDIPVMIFTLEQWDALSEGEFHIGAAPIGPKELGRNSRYVFALPARYNFAFPTGYEEVESILEKDPLKTFEIDE